MRAVLDVNVLVSAVIGSGAPADIIAAWREGRFDLIVSERLLAELGSTMARPKISRRVSPPETTAFMELLRQGALAAVDPDDPPKRSRDADDDYLLALAEATDAMLVSGDGDLLELAGRFPVASPRDFLAMLD